MCYRMVTLCVGNGWTRRGGNEMQVIDWKDGPYIWLNEGEDDATDDRKLVTLVRDYDDSGDPAVFLSDVAKAAPDLLAVLQQVLTDLESGEYDNIDLRPDFEWAVLTDIRAAIDKATTGVRA